MYQNIPIDRKGILVRSVALFLIQVSTPQKLHIKVNVTIISRYHHPVDNFVKLYHAIYVRNLQHVGPNHPCASLLQ